MLSSENAWVRMAISIRAWRRADFGGILFEKYWSASPCLHTGTDEHPGVFHCFSASQRVMKAPQKMYRSLMVVR
jgi:hypothetical protein